MKYIKIIKLKKMAQVTNIFGPQFKIGDRVRCKDATGIFEIERGKTYIVEDITNELYGLGLSIRKEEIDEKKGEDDHQYWDEGPIGTFNAKRFKIDISYVRRQKLNKIFKRNKK